MREETRSHSLHAIERRVDGVGRIPSTPSSGRGRGAAGASLAFGLRSDCPDVHTSAPSSYAQLLELWEHGASRTGAHVSDTAGYCRLEGPHVAPEGVGQPALRSECKGGCAQANGGKRNQHTRHIFSGTAQKKKMTERRGANPAFCHAVAAVAATQR